MASKQCTKCGQVKDTTEFWRNKKNPDGYQYMCKPCLGQEIKRGKQGKPSKTELLQQEAAALLARGIKRCPKCKAIKPISEFYKNKAAEDGLQKQCKPCFGHSARKYKNKPGIHPKLVEHTRKWQRENPDRVLQMARELYYNNPQKTKARSRVSMAVARGDLPRANTQKCIHCQGKARHYHHHNGYDDNHLLDVIPVCTKCHGKEHRTGSKYDNYEFG